MSNISPDDLDAFEQKYLDKETSLDPDLVFIVKAICLELRLTWNRLGVVLKNNPELLKNDFFKAVTMEHIAGAANLQIRCPECSKPHGLGIGLGGPRIEKLSEKIETTAEVFELEDQQKPLADLEVDYEIVDDRKLLHGGFLKVRMIETHDDKRDDSQKD